MSSIETSTWRIEEVLAKTVGQKPNSQKIANGILSISKDMLENGKLQLECGIKEDNYPLTEDMLRKVLEEACGTSSDKAKSYAAFTFRK